MIMRLFDSVVTKCPSCKQGDLQWQSKAGNCYLQEYGLNRVPVDIAEDIMGKLETCQECGNTFRIERVPPDPQVVAMKVVGF